MEPIDKDSDYCPSCSGSGYYVDAQGDHQDCRTCLGSGSPIEPATDPDAPNPFHRVEFEGFAVMVFRDNRGRVTVDIDTSEAAEADTFPNNGVPRLRVTVNEEDRETQADGEWGPLEEGSAES